MMRVLTVLGVTVLFSTGIWGVNQQTLAIRLADGTVYFAQPPRLVKATTTFRNPGVPAIYYFTLSLPETAGEPLQRVTFTQKEGIEDIKFNLKRTHAEAVESSDSKQQLTLGEVTRDSKTQTVSVTFNPPVPAGRTVKIALRSVSNPLYGGIYLFAVTAFPAGEKSHGQFLGFGRLQFSIPSGSP